MPIKTLKSLFEWTKKPVAHRALKTLSVLGKCLLTIVLVAIITGSIVGCVMVVYVVTSFDVENSIPDLHQINANETSIVMTQNEKSGEWQEFLRLEGTNHIWVDIEEIPLAMQNAVIAIEDERFREHYGVDWKRTVSAFANLVLRFSSTEYGGSTLTQQLVKVLTGDNSHDVTRKMTEIFRAIEMEKNYTKEEILEAYLNMMPLTGDIQGVAVGANHYFGKEISELSIAECAVIASITQNPSYYHPYYHPENLRDRQQVVLFKMHELGFITDDEYVQALGEELVFSSSLALGTIQDYYTDMVVESVINDLMSSYGYGYAQAQAMVYYGGLTIYSYEQPSIQKSVEKLYADESIYPDSLRGDEEDPRVAFFALDYDGKVIATVGDRGEKTGNRVQNIATMSARQPGSSIKPLSVYALAVDMNLINYSSLLRDAPVMTSNGEPWPPNYGQRPGDRGYRTVQYALEVSLNTIPARILHDDLGVVPSYQFLTNTLGLTTLDPANDVDYSPLALGGMTNGTHLSELTAGYQIFGNGGVYNGFYCYDKVTQKGETILQSEPKGIRAIEEDSSYVMNRLLQQVVRGSQGTLRVVGSSWPRMEVFAKTGTTDDNNDVLAIGGTPYYIGGCWFGYRYNQEMTYEQAQAVKQLWNKGMLAIHSGLSAKSFEPSDETVECEYCTSTGLLARKGCPSTKTGVYRKSNVPGLCSSHGGAALAPETNTTKPPKQTTAPTTTTTGGNSWQTNSDPSSDPTTTSPSTTSPAEPSTTESSGATTDNFFQPPEE